MKIGILGTGDVGKALGKGFLALGHEVKMGGREASNEKAAAWVKESGERASQGTFGDAAGFGEIIVLATLGVGTESAIKMAGAEKFSGKVVIDTTNPLDFSKGGPALAVGFSDSGGEQIQRLIPDAHVVKAFNTVGNALMFKPDLPGGPPDMFICGNSDDAKKRVGEICTDFGWGVVDLGGIEASRYLEPMCLAWVLYGIRSKNWGHAFKLLGK
ncbi:MAG TPA: NAD(P)-binding domain-containing protein [Polyangiaceae bacterium]|jgi:predicted dinucleotide-binding enzyme|nr:NAD(P)-binding domain-containing protein [Polyangiaceae bacterium]